MSEFIPLRLSHLLRHSSIGAVLRGPDYLVTIEDARHWKNAQGLMAARRILYVERVRKALGIAEDLCEPPLASLLDNGQVDGAWIPAQRFPSWMRCPRCGLLHHRPWAREGAEEKPRCRHPENHKGGKGPELAQAPWVMVHVDGHMDDVPWHVLAHREAKTPKQKQCQWNRDDDCLYLVKEQDSMWRLRCAHCTATHDFSKTALNAKGYLQTLVLSMRSQPWDSTRIDLKKAEEAPIILEVNDARVHFSVTRSALVIPPESRISQGTVLDKLYSTPEKIKDIDSKRTELARQGVLRHIATEYGCSKEDVETAWKEIQKGYPFYGQELSVTPELLLQQEYEALIEEIPGLCDDEAFVTRHHTKEWKEQGARLPEDSRARRIVDAVASVVEVTRLKEVLVFEGFCRVEFRPDRKVPPDLVGQNGWLPALELFGEGVFFTLDEGALGRWAVNQSLISRAQATAQRFKASDMRYDAVVTARFLLLHTLAHALIRQLESEAGYPAASLKERIYCAEDNSGKTAPMAGILIYVAVPDKAGSLGGLAELAAPSLFLPLLVRVFERLEWCSLDPVCSEHEGQGPMLINRAACHACALIPEPCCAFGNTLLDRIFIKGDLAGEIKPFLHFVDVSPRSNDGETKV